MPVRIGDNGHLATPVHAHHGKGGAQIHSYGCYSRMPAPVLDAGSGIVEITANTIHNNVQQSMSIATTVHQAKMGKEKGNRPGITKVQVKLASPMLHGMTRWSSAI